MGASSGGANLEIPPWDVRSSNSDPLSGLRTLSGGQFDWGGRLLKGNGGTQRFAQCAWKSHVECIGISELDCKGNSPSRWETRAK